MDDFSLHVDWIHIFQIFPGKVFPRRYSSVTGSIDFIGNFLSGVEFFENYVGNLQVKLIIRVDSRGFVATLRDTNVPEEIIVVASLLR